MNNTYLVHSIKGSTWTKKNHKYIAKVKIGKWFRYFYNKADYEKWLKNNKDNKDKIVEAIDENIFDPIEQKLRDRRNKNYRLQYAESQKKHYQVVAAKEQSRNQKYISNKRQKVYVDDLVKREKEKTSRINNEYAKIHNDIITKKAINAERLRESNKTRSKQTAINEYTKRHGANDPLIKELGLVYNESKIFGIGESAEISQKNTNPNYNQNKDNGYSTNCARCTFAWDMRQRGYDVTATKYDPSQKIDGYGLQSTPGMNLYYKDTPDHSYFSTKYTPLAMSAIKNSEKLDQKYETNERKWLRKELDSQANGSSGNLSVNWFYGGAHSMVWEKRGNQVIIRDAQTNATYNSVDELFNKTEILDCSYYRTDNLEINLEAAKMLVKNRG